MLPQLLLTVQVILDDPASTTGEEQSSHCHHEAADLQVLHHPELLRVSDPVSSPEVLCVYLLTLLHAVHDEVDVECD